MIVVAILGGLAGVAVMLVLAGALLNRPSRSGFPTALPSSATSSQQPAQPFDEPTPSAQPAQPFSQPTQPPTGQRSNPPPAQQGNIVDFRFYQVGPATRIACRSIPTPNTRALGGLLVKVSACLERAWQPSLAGVGMSLPPPNTVFFSTPGRSPCGNYPPPGQTPAFYCSSNATIYLGPADATSKYGFSPSRSNYIYAALLAHEFGHHLQDQAGLLYAQAVISAHSSPAKVLDVSRRVELQAQCLSGMFMRSVQDSYPLTPQRRRTLLQAFYSLGDDPRGPSSARDHGTLVNNGRWFAQGFQNAPHIAACNTFRARAADVA